MMYFLHQGCTTLPQTVGHQLGKFQMPKPYRGIVLIQTHQWPRSPATLPEDPSDPSAVLGTHIRPLTTVCSSSPRELSSSHNRHTHKVIDAYTEK